VPIAFVKGPTLVKSAWKDEGIRSYGDLDIFMPSAEAANALVADLKGDAAPQKPLSWSHTSPGKAHLEVDGWKLELCVPVGPPRGPAFEMMARHPERLFSVPESDEAPAAPEPSFHFVFMLQHLMQHRCSRLICGWPRKSQRWNIVPLHGTWASLSVAVSEGPFPSSPNRRPDGTPQFIIA